MTSDEFLKIAAQNNAIRPIEEARKDAIETFERYQIYVGLFDDWHVIDTKSTVYRGYQFLIKSILSVICLSFVAGMVMVFYRIMFH